MAVISDFRNKVPSWPIHGPDEEAALRRVLNSKAWWRGIGQEASQFEHEFANFLGVEHVRLVSSGSGALEIALQLCGIRPGDEVLVPACTFIATASAVLRMGAVPIPVDVVVSTLCMDPADMERKCTRQTRAVIPVHMAGQAAHFDHVLDIAKAHQLRVIEDAAHAHGAEWNGRKLGSFGDVAIFSFQAGKLMTGGEGGAVVINDPALASRSFQLHSCGRPEGDTEYQHLEIAGNWRLPEFVSAVLRAQLNRLPRQLTTREKAAAYFEKALASLHGITPLERAPETSLHGHYMSMFWFDPDHFGGRDASQISAALRQMGLPAFKCFPAVQNTGMFSREALAAVMPEPQKLPDFSSIATPNADRAAQHVVWFHHSLLLSDINLLRDIVEVVGGLTEEHGFCGNGT